MNFITSELSYLHAHNETEARINITTTRVLRCTFFLHILSWLGKKKDFELCTKYASVLVKILEYNQDGSDGVQICTRSLWRCARNL